MQPMKIQQSLLHLYYMWYYIMLHKAALTFLKSAEVF